jgi:hypothetical protein
MSIATVLERPVVVEFETVAENGITEVPDQYRNAFLEHEKKIARENIRRLLDKGNEHGKKYGITEDVIAAEIESYRREKEAK